MILSRQSGIALVQVLLISALLLLLVVQLSLTAKKSVELAIQLKEKSQASLKSLEQFNNAQYFLLTQPEGYSLVWNNGVTANFSSSPFEAAPGIKVRLQDMSGLLSTSFFGSEWNNYVKGDAQKLSVLIEWQGLSEGLRDSKGKRNAMIPYVEEIRLLNSWQNQPLDYVTRLPTSSFNVAMTPVPLLREIYAEDTINQVLAVRSSGDYEWQNFERIEGIEDSSPFPRSKFIQVRVEVQPSDGINYSRSRIYDVQTGKKISIVEIGIGTP